MESNREGKSIFAFSMATMHAEELLQQSKAALIVLM
jgi:hypothetical protein